MCGRFTVTVTLDLLAEFFGVTTLPADMPPLAPRYNVAPSQPVLIVRAGHGRGSRELAHVVWGLVPPWAGDPSIGNRMINARAETVADKPAFRNAIRRRRCIVPATGFFEWERTGASRQPHLFRMADGKPFGMAGLWENWMSDDGSEIQSAAILTTKANRLVGRVHDRMPVILERESYGRWLDAGNEDVTGFGPLLVAFPAEAMTSLAVSRVVNSPRNDTPECLSPAPQANPDKMDDLFGGKN
jgi:putative SOS response-associated peptidase YedK